MTDRELLDRKGHEVNDELPPLPEPSKGFGLDAAIEHLQRIQKMGGSRRWRLVVRKFNPGGMSGHGTTEVDSIAAGFDWEAGRVVITPAKPMTELTPEDVEAITKSVRAGGSWHAYKSQEKLRERALKAEARVAELEMQAEAAADQLRAAVLAERERCAKVCETEAESLGSSGKRDASALCCAAAIRAETKSPE